MKSILSLVCIIALFMITPAFATGDPAAGKQLYAKRCSSCHGTAGEGKETIAKTLKVEMRHLGSKEVQATSDADLKKEIREGKGKMKAVAGVDEKAADDLVAYLRSLKK